MWASHHWYGPWLVQASSFTFQATFPPVLIDRLGIDKLSSTVDVFSHNAPGFNHVYIQLGIGIRLQIGDSS